MNINSSNSPKNIVFVINDLKGNGAERVVITLARAFAKEGHKSHIVCFNDTIEYDTEDLSISFFRLKYFRWIPRKWRGRALSWLLDRFIVKCADAVPDLVLSNLLPCDRILSMSTLPNVRLVVHSVLSRERGNDFPELVVYGRKPAVCVSKGVLDDLIQLLPEKAYDSCVIHNPVDSEDVSELSQVKIDIPKKPYIVHVGKFKAEKRHDILLKAFAKSSYSGDLVLVGQGPLRAVLEELVVELKISHRVNFVGYHANPYPFMKNSELLVLSSDYEGLGMVLLEAISLGVPVLSTDCPHGPRDILDSCQLVPVGDVDALALALSVQNLNIYKAYLHEYFNLEFALKKYLELV